MTIAVPNCASQSPRTGSLVMRRLWQSLGSGVAMSLPINPPICVNRSVQIFGSSGYTKKSRVARHFLDSRATMIYEGANEVLTLKIGSQSLGHEFRAY
jgi:hypothetical protein